MDREGTLTDRYFKLSRQLEPRFLTEHVPMVWNTARGVTVWDIGGKEYLDCTSGIFVAAIGHSHPKYVKAVSAQVERLLTCYDRLNEPRIKLAEKLLRLIPETRGKNKIYLLTTGSEAVEAAVKFSRDFSSKAEVLSFYMSVYGRTNFTLTLGAKKRR